MCANTFVVIHSEAQLLVLVLLTLFLCSSSCSPHGRYNQETPALKMPAQMSTQRRAPETTVGAMLPGQTVCAFCPFQNRKAGSFCTYVLAHICFCSNLNPPIPILIPLESLQRLLHKQALHRCQHPSGRVAMQHTSLFSVGLKNRHFSLK